MSFDAKRRAAILAAALIPRLVIAFVTFGSVDAMSILRDTLRVLDGKLMTAPYLPGLELWIWASSVVSSYTSLPLLFPAKVFPLVGDSLIALLLFESNKDRAAGFRDGLLYALTPIGVIISSIHPQWDGIWLYFLLLALVLVRLEGRAPSAIAAAALVLSVIIKPIAAPLALVVLPRDRRRATAFILGGIVTTAIYVGLLATSGFLPSLDELAGILHYAQHGVLQFGLPYRPWNRVAVILGALAVFAVLHFARRITRDEAALLYLATAIGVSGLSIQYLLWVVPLALFCGYRRFYAFYTLAAGLFVVFYYQLPLVNLLNAENLGAFALLEPLGSWSPPPITPAIRPAMLMIGNFIVPLSCLALVAYRVATAVLKPAVSEVESPPRVRAYVTPAVCMLLLVAIVAAWAALLPPLSVDRFVARVNEKVEAYDVVRYTGPTSMRKGSRIWIARSFAEPGVGNRVLNLRTLFVAWVISASIAAAIPRRRMAP